MTLGLKARLFLRRKPNYEKCFFLSLKSNFRWKKSFFFIKKSNFFLKTNSKAKSLKTETNLSKLGEKKNNSIFLNVFLFMHKSPNRNKKPDTIEDEGEVI